MKSLLQENNTLKYLGFNLKRIDYDYDLVSGKVNFVYYQRDSIDQFTHHYQYDDDNRITHVYTSRDGLSWDEDAHYQYYMHGPLARVELGEDKVQGIDYAYTLQGWMKGINSGTLDPSRDMGSDGAAQSTGINPVSRDAYGFNLGYFNQDYRPIGTSNFEANYNLTSGSTFGDDSYSTLRNKGLYNGNIRHSVLAMDSLNYPNLGFIYQYDQLNRLKHMRAYNGLDTTNNEWTTAAVLNDYQENIDYDPNGNIMNYERFATRNRGPHLHMDELEYKYNSGTNQLDHVNDQIVATNYPDDIDDQSSGNYTYDHIGNLTIDVSQGEQYGWWNNGKLAEVGKFVFGDPTDFDIQYGYDPMGNRIEKYTQKYDGTGDYSFFFYVRDAQGNIMATYLLDNFETEYKLKELNMYGSSRLGVLNADTVIFDYTTHTSSNIQSPWVGKKMYELTNHLGNVLATVTDKKVLYDNNNDNLADWSVPEISSAGDYYPFGMQMPGRNYQAGGYRFGFNGKENDNDVKGVGNSLDFGARIYDPRLGRWLSVDKLSNTNPSWSPYKSFNDNAIIYVDPDGKKEFIKVVFIDAEGHSVVFRKQESLDIMTDGVKHSVADNLGVGPVSEWHYENNYYDYEKVVTISLNKDGTHKVTESTNILTDGAVRDADVVLGKGANSRDSKNDWKAEWNGLKTGGSQASGFKLVTDEGGPDGTKRKATKGDVQTLNISPFLDILGVLTLQPGELPSLNEALGPAELVDNLTELKEESVKLIEKAKSATNKHIHFSVSMSTCDNCHDTFPSNNVDPRHEKVRKIEPNEKK